MYNVDLDFVLCYTPPMSDNEAGIRLTRTIELPFPPTENTSVFSKEFEGIDEIMGYELKEVTWDLDRNCFIAETSLSVTGTPVAMIPLELANYLNRGWTCGSYKDT